VRRAPLIVAVAWAALFVPPGTPAAAHPQGIRPVALIRQLEPTRLEVLWVVAADDFRLLLEAQGVLAAAGALSPAEAAARLRGYLAERVVVANEGAPCGEEVTGAGAAGPGVAISLRFTCPTPLARTRITITLLQDLSPDYVTIVQARTPGGVARGVVTAQTPTVRLDFQAARPSVEPEAPVRRGPVGRTGRLVAAVQGGPGATPLALAAGLAFLLGALHALTPGHGKTMTAAYLVGVGGTMRQALALGGVVSVTHAASVALLGVLAVALDRLLLPGTWVPWTEVAAGLLTVGVGVGLLRRGPDHGSPGRVHAHGRGHAHARGHGHGRVHGHARPHAEATGLPWRRLAVLGLVGGLVPSPEALGVLLVALTVGRWAAGMALVSAFSIGLAVVVLGVAAAAVRGGALVRRVAGGRLGRALPVAAATLVVGVGAFLAVRGASRLL
jgi:ABC-type nickel/cobalt efflux system permease component RcnA